MTKLRSTRPYLVMGTQGYEGYLAEGYRGTVRVQKWQPLPVPTTHSGLPIPLPIPTSNQQKVAAVYSCLEVPCVGRFAQVCLQQMHGPHGQHSRPRSKPSCSLGITRSGQGPNSCVFIKAPAKGPMTSWPNSRP